MKRRIVFGIILLIVFLIIKPGNLKTTQEANIRTEPNIEAEVKCVVSSKTILQAEEINSNNEWLKISKINSEKTDNAYIHKSVVEKRTNWKKVFFILFILYVVVSFFKTCQETKCPKCKKPFAKKRISRQYIGNEDGYETVTRTDVNKNRNGVTIGTTERQEQVHVIYKKYRNIYKCKKCGYEWAIITQER